MLRENVLPPIPSEIIMPLAGYLSAREDTAFWGAVAAGSRFDVVEQYNGVVSWVVVGGAVVLYVARVVRITGRASG